MFKKRPDGVEIYFSWPASTARIVPNESVRRGIVLRDNAMRALVGVMVLIASLLHGESIALGVTMLIIGIACFVERSRYLSKLRKVSLELKPAEAPEAAIRSKTSDQITEAEVDKAYIAGLGMFTGVLLTVIGVLCTAIFLHMHLKQDAQNALPLFLSIPLLFFPFAIMTYVGLRIIVGKRAEQRAKRARRRR